MLPQDVLLHAVAGDGDFLTLVRQYTLYTLTCTRIRDLLGDAQVEVMGLCAWKFLTALAELCKDQTANGTEGSEDSDTGEATAWPCFLTQWW